MPYVLDEQSRRALYDYILVWALNQNQDTFNMRRDYGFRIRIYMFFVFRCVVRASCLHQKLGSITEWLTCHHKCIGVRSCEMDTPLSTQHPVEYTYA